MRTFKNLESLLEYLKWDAEQISLNPVRFINVDSMAMWIEVKKALLSLADEMMPLSKFCEGPDTTPNINRMSAALKKANKSQLVTPLSEFLRVVPEQAEQVIQKIIKADYSNNDQGRVRIYYLMYRMKSLFRTLPQDDPRAKDCISLLETDEESDYKLTIVQRNLDVRLTGNEIDGFKSYLEYWEANPDKPLILQTDNAIHFEKNHFFDDVHVIVTSYDLIKFQYGLPAGVGEELGDEENWNDLLKVIVKEGSFEEACCASLSINKYMVALFERWNQFSSFQKWLLWLWTRLQAGARYEIIAAKSSKAFSCYIDELYCCIIDYLNTEHYQRFYGERKHVLSLIQSVPTERFWNRFNALNKKDALLCLTCLTDVEQKRIFTMISGVDYKNRSNILVALKTVFPALYYYLQNDDQPNSAHLSSNHEKYFSEYKWLKATDTVSDEFISTVKSIAAEKGASVFSMKPRNVWVSERYDDATSILFVDGMGLEYVDYLAHLFSDLDEQKYSVTIDAGYCSLPSITEINKDFMNGRNTVEPPVRELDELKHSNNAHPESLIKQLRILDGLKNRVLGLMVGNIHRIIIAADHGTSRLAVKVRNTDYDNVYPRPEKASVYKYGRFCENTEDEVKYPTAINYNEKLVFADYSRFVQNGAPIDEIHGGAALEEWLVPIVTVERFVDSKTMPVELKPLATKVKPKVGSRMVRISFTISGKTRESVFARVNGASYRCEFIDGVYTFGFVPAKTDSSVMVKVVDGGLLGQFSIEIEQGLKKNNNFDI